MAQAPDQAVIYLVLMPVCIILMAVQYVSQTTTSMVNPFLVLQLKLTTELII
jgi:hypothetical protein